MFKDNTKVNVIGFVLVSLLCRCFTPCFSVSIVNFEHVIAGSLAVSQAKIINNHATRS